MVWDKEEEHGVARVQLQRCGLAWLMVDAQLQAFHLHVIMHSKVTHDYSQVGWKCPQRNVVDTSCDSRYLISLFDCIRHVELLGEMRGL